MKLEIPGYKSIEIENVVFDYNGTLAKDGKIYKQTAKLLELVCKKFDVFVITADTFGTVNKELKSYNISIKVLTTTNHTKEKSEFIVSLDSDKTIALGNGNNDKEMLKTAALGIAIIGSEGCSKEALFSSDIICKDIKDAIGLLLNPKRLKATLRR